MKILFKLTILIALAIATSFEYWVVDSDTTENPNPLSYDDAQDSCKAWGGYLAIVNEENYRQIINQIENTRIARGDGSNGSINYWIGAKFLIYGDFSSI